MTLFKRARAWAEVEHFLSTLPPQLHQQAILLQHDLATHYSDSGQFRDILCRPHDYPLLSWHLWLLDDLNIPDDDERARFEDAVLAGMLFGFMATYLQERILDESSFMDAGFLFLAQLLAQKASNCFAALFPPDSPFWQDYWACWQAYGEESLGVGRLAPGKLPLYALTSWLPLMDADSLLQELFDHFNLAFQTLSELSTVRRDLAQGRETRAIRQTLEAAGLASTGPLSVERVLGALILTGSGARLCEEALEHLEVCRALATRLRLPTVQRYLGGMVERSQQLKALLSLRGMAGALPAGFFVAAPNPLGQAIEMAERYLLSDLTFRESWEVQRQGLFNQPELTGRAFPSGLVIEILCQHGHPLGEQIDFLFHLLHTHGFHYYDYSVGLPDADDLGLLLRLHRYAATPLAQRARLEQPLRWMEGSVAASGEIPVWFATGEKSEQEALLWGERCATVEINLLLGLMAYDWAHYQPLIERASRPLLARWLRSGLGATAHYTPLASLWLLREFLEKLASHTASPPLMEEVDALRPMLYALTAAWGRYRASPQNAAFLLLTSFSGEHDLSENRWLSAILKRQRYDGSWPGEPLYVCPNRGRATVWYSSNTVTTAFCYHALKQYAGRGTEGRGKV